MQKKDLSVFETQSTRPKGLADGSLCSIDISVHEQWPSGRLSNETGRPLP